MIGSVISEYRSYSFFIGSTKTVGTDSSFDKALAEAAEDDLLKKAPDKWVTEAGLSSDAINKAVEYMRNELGINVGGIEPTHGITDEQTAWLSSRYDFSTMQRYVRYTFVNDSGITQYGTKSTAEYSNFLADLTFLGVFTAKELNEMWVEPFDTRAGSDQSQSILSTRFNEIWGSDNALDAADMFVKHLEKMFGFYDERSKDPTHAVDGDAEFAALIKEHFLPLPKIFAEIVRKLTGGDDETLPRSSAVPRIENAADKLKEDFAGLGQNG